ncbi:GatB/YqeY domain-containing protein [Nocardiopsis alba]|uniref:hypothetical protein n=1 Tax=Nocardiopsis alba TaxID=53437 RepID=UPI00034587CD|nr:hypothetical protein [Nocardiopsis alba]
MNDRPRTPPTADVDAPRARMRADLVTAMRERRRETVSALRTALAALDNAEAAPAPETPSTTVNEHVAGSRSGVGSTEAPRRVLSADRVRALLNEQIEERTVEADRYEAHGRHDAARRLRTEADALRPYL